MASGLVLTDRYATWDRAPFLDGGTYAVSVHRRLTQFAGQPDYAA
jgi:hypothetical protein